MIKNKLGRCVDYSFKNQYCFPTELYSFICNNAFCNCSFLSEQVRARESQKETETKIVINMYSNVTKISCKVK